MSDVRRRPPPSPPNRTLVASGAGEPAVSPPVAAPVEVTDPASPVERNETLLLLVEDLTFELTEGVAQDEAPPPPVVAAANPEVSAAPASPGVPAAPASPEVSAAPASPGVSARPSSSASPPAVPLPTIPKAPSVPRVQAKAAGSEPRSRRGLPVGWLAVGVVVLSFGAWVGLETRSPPAGESAIDKSADGVEGARLATTVLQERASNPSPEAVVLGDEKAEPASAATGSTSIATGAANGAAEPAAAGTATGAANGGAEPAAAGTGTGAANGGAEPVAAGTGTGAAAAAGTAAAGGDTPARVVVDEGASRGADEASRLKRGSSSDVPGQASGRPGGGADRLDPSESPSVRTTESAETLLAQAREAEKAGKAALAYRLASQSLAKQPSDGALEVKVRAACTMGQKDAAEVAYDRLPRARRRELRTVCAERGVRLGL